MRLTACRATSSDMSSCVDARSVANRRVGGWGSRCSSAAVSRHGRAPGEARHRHLQRKQPARRGASHRRPAISSWARSRAWRSLAWPGGERQ
jgi:hypothetical protein